MSFTSEVRGKAPADKNFGAFWVLEVSSPVVLLCKNCLCRPPICAYNLMHLHASHNSFKKLCPVEITIMKFKLRILNEQRLIEL